MLLSHWLIPTKLTVTLYFTIILCYNLHLGTTHPKSLSLEKNQMLEIPLSASFLTTLLVSVSLIPPANWPNTEALSTFSVNHRPRIRLESWYNCNRSNITTAWMLKRLIPLQISTQLWLLVIAPLAHVSFLLQFTTSLIRDETIEVYMSHSPLIHKTIQWHIPYSWKYGGKKIGDLASKTLLVELNLVVDQLWSLGTCA